jgi:hypothetical protein
VWLKGSRHFRCRSGSHHTTPFSFLGGIMANKFGWEPNPEGVDYILGDPDTPRVYAINDRDRAAIAHDLTRQEPLLLTDALLQLNPNFKRGGQSRGTCVGWGWEIGCRIAHAVDIVIDKEPWKFVGEFSTESIYGLSRCEARGRSYAGFRDGSYGAAAAKGVTKWGALPRANYAIVTGNKDHDVTKHSEDRAVQYGAYGNGGKHDSGKLDEICKRYPVGDTVLVTTFDDAASCILNGWPIPVCSGQGFTKTRDDDGFCKPRGSWSHCMCFVGVRFDRPGLLCMNSWFHSNSGPHGIETHEEVMKASFWVDASVADKMLRGQDSFAITGVNGLEKRTVDFSTGWEI